MKDDVNLYQGLPKIDQGTVRVVNYIFERLAGIIPSMDYSARNQVGIDSKKREYTYQLMQENITDMAVINMAIEKIRNDDLTFLPTPSEFVKYCNPYPEDIGAPSPEVAYYEACFKLDPIYRTDKNWSHIAVRNAAIMVGSHDLSSEPTIKTKSMFKDAYKQAIKDYSANQCIDQTEKNKLSKERKNELHKGGAR